MFCDVDVLLCSVIFCDVDVVLCWCYVLLCDDMLMRYDVDLM